MLQRIVNFVVTVVGVLLALLIGFWTLLSLVVVAVGAAIVFAFRSRGWRRARKKHREGVIEGEFSVVDEDEQHERKEQHSHSSHQP
jgi:uncharacterized membrane protein